MISVCENNVICINNVIRKNKFSDYAGVKEYLIFFDGHVIFFVVKMNCIFSNCFVRKMNWDKNLSINFLN